MSHSQGHCRTSFSAQSSPHPGPPKALPDPKSCRAEVSDTQVKVTVTSLCDMKSTCYTGRTVEPKSARTGKRKPPEPCWVLQNAPSSLPPSARLFYTFLSVDWGPLPLCQHTVRQDLLA